MSEELNNIAVSAVKSQEQGQKLMEKLLTVAQARSVYSEAVSSGEYTIITASEVSVGVGFGGGMGGGGGESDKDEANSTDESQDQAEEVDFGSGFGGGGGAMGRPVAVISIGPKGVRVEPVVDPTKIVLAFFTMLGSMFIMLYKMRQASRG